MKPKRCRKCRGRDVKIWDCGYSSFNVGGVKCLNPKCGHEVKVSPCGCFPNDELISAWNADKPTDAEKLTKANREIKRLRMAAKWRE